MHAKLNADKKKQREKFRKNVKQTNNLLQTVMQQQQTHKNFDKNTH